MMSWRLVALLVVGALLAFAACGPGGTASSQASATRPSATPGSAPPTADSSESLPATSASRGASVCRQTGEPGAVAVTVADFEFKPALIDAEVGQIIAFTNTGFEPHNATTAEGGCATHTLETGEGDGLVFSVPGSYAFGCAVHPWMTGAFTIAP